MADAEPPRLPGTSREFDARVYDELRAIARARMRHERANHTLQPTDLVHEVFNRLSLDGSLAIESREHFLALAGRIMRQYLIDYARRRKTVKHGGTLVRIPLDDVLEGQEWLDVEVLDLERALRELERADPKAAEVVHHKFYCGFKDAEVAALFGRSEKWVGDQWRRGRTWLRARLDGHRG